MMGAFASSVVVGAETRTYYMFVPPTYDPQMPQRLVLGYHGSNYTGMMMRRYLDLERAPLLDRTIFVYPDGMNAAMAWNTSQNSRDMAYFDALVAKLQAEYCIDRDRILATGQSYGALITNALGCYKGDVLRAIAVAAGSGPRASTCLDRVAVWITHGMDDGNVDFASGEGSRDFWVRANGCTTTTAPGDPAQCLNYQGCMPGYPVIWCPHVGDAGHQIPSFGREAMRRFLASF
jgi:poly(3-hydroxybutyrate) depolymerase